jgi:hypothetical protein
MASEESERRYRVGNFTKGISEKKDVATAGKAFAAGKAFLAGPLHLRDIR